MLINHANGLQPSISSQWCDYIGISLNGYFYSHGLFERSPYADTHT